MKTSILRSIATLAALLLAGISNAYAQDDGQQWFLAGDDGRFGVFIDRKALSFDLGNPDAFRVSRLIVDNLAPANTPLEISTLRIHCGSMASLQTHRWQRVNGVDTEKDHSLSSWIPSNIATLLCRDSGDVELEAYGATPEQAAARYRQDHNFQEHDPSSSLATLSQRIDLAREEVSSHTGACINLSNVMLGHADFMARAIKSHPDHPEVGEMYLRAMWAVREATEWLDRCNAEPSILD